MKYLGKGIAVLGIWAAVAIIGGKDPKAGVVLSFFATIATVVVCAPK